MSITPNVSIDSYHFSLPHTHGCCKLIESDSFIARIYNAYQKAVQSLAQCLFKNGWQISCYIVASLLGEPIDSISSAVRGIFGWKNTWKKHGFYDAGDENSLKRLQETLKSENVSSFKTPLILFHAIYSSPDVWLSWAPELEKARNQKEIGHIITLQLPNNFVEGQQLVRTTIQKISKIYQETSQTDTLPQIDLAGHSFGGYLAHIAAYKSEMIHDEKGIERRWHCVEKRDSRIRKVVSIAAPTWLCCHGQTDAFHPKNHDIYPLEGFSHEQLETIKNSHSNIYDIVAKQDAISVTTSPLPKKQIHFVQHGHLGITQCRDVCRLVLSILKS